MTRKTKAELLEEIELLEDGLASVNRLANEFEEHGMMQDRRVEELEESLSDAEGSVWDLKYAIEHAETLEDLEDLKNRLHFM